MSAQQPNDGDGDDDSGLLEMQWFNDNYVYDNDDDSDETMVMVLIAGVVVVVVMIVPRRMISLCYKVIAIFFHHLARCCCFSSCSLSVVQLHVSLSTSTQNILYLMRWSVLRLLHLTFALSAVSAGTTWVVARRMFPEQCSSIFHESLTRARSFTDRLLTRCFATAAHSRRECNVIF